MNNVYTVLVFKNSFTLLTINFAEIRIAVDHTFKERNYFYFVQKYTA